MRGALSGWALLLAALATASCAATEETTPHGYVIAPSVPADAGAMPAPMEGGAR